MASAVCNSRQIWNEVKFRCECKEDLVNKMGCDKRYIWNPSNCACECEKSCGIDQYLDYKSCVCRNTLVEKLVGKCTDVVDGDIIYNETLTVTSSNDFDLCTLYAVLFSVFLSTRVIISGDLVCFHWYKKKHN